MDCGITRVVEEPSGRDTLPALTLAMATIVAEDPSAVVAVLTADHLIEPLGAFSATLERGFHVAESSPDALVTFGVVPDHPATGFGYLELGEPLTGDALVVARFAEKPQLKRAEQLVEAGALWNSGMFVWQAATFLRAVEAFAPETLALVQAVLAGDIAAWDQIAKVSVDYGVMEPASTSPDFTVAALPLAARWLDVGSWPAYGDAVGTDDNGNAVGAKLIEPRQRSGDRLTHAGIGPQRAEHRADVEQRRSQPVRDRPGRLGYRCKFSRDRVAHVDLLPLLVGAGDVTHPAGDRERMGVDR